MEAWQDPHSAWPGSAVAGKPLVETSKVTMLLEPGQHRVGLALGGRLQGDDGAHGGQGHEEEGGEAAHGGGP